jgi:hypothetical protein
MLDFEFHFHLLQSSKFYSIKKITQFLCNRYPRFVFYIMAPRKMMKNIDAAGEGSNLNADVLSDTMPLAIDSVKSWTHVFEILEHEVISCPEDYGDEVDDTHGAKLKYVA